MQVSPRGGQHNHPPPTTSPPPSPVFGATGRVYSAAKITLVAKCFTSYLYISRDTSLSCPFASIWRHNNVVVLSIFASVFVLSTHDQRPVSNNKQLYRICKSWLSARKQEELISLKILLCFCSETSDFKIPIKVAISDAGEGRRLVHKYFVCYQSAANAATPMQEWNSRRSFRHLQYIYY